MVIYNFKCIDPHSLHNIIMIRAIKMSGNAK